LPVTCAQSNLGIEASQQEADGAPPSTGAWARQLGGGLALSVVLAFFFGYSLTMRPLVRWGIALKTAVARALASDTASSVPR
jgi:hypothetical protein